MLKRLKRDLGELGYKQGTRDSKERHYRSIGDTRLAIECDIDARYDLSVLTRYHLGFKPASRLFLLSHDELCCRKSTSDSTFLDRFVYSDEDFFKVTIFTCLQERLLGIEDWTHDEIVDPDEFEVLYERTLRNIKTHGLPYFEKYGSPQAVLAVIESDSDEWRFLQNTRGQFLAAAAAMVGAYRGRQALENYLARHDTEPEFCGGDDRMQAEIILELLSSDTAK